ncbi:MAG: DNA/RNA nuclease SfsA [Candidatus Bathyarchaeia archaeon]
MRVPLMKMNDVLSCSILERVNRFVVKVIINKEEKEAYITNTGRLNELLVKGKTGFCIKKSSCKIDYKLFAIKDSSDLCAIIDTQLQMRSFERCLEMGLAPSLKACKILKRNAKLGNSLIDYLIFCENQSIYLEVKSAVLRNKNYAMYPDCPSSRGQRHIRDLINHVKSGGVGMILFLAALPDVTSFKPNEEGDPEIYKLLEEALKVGVKLASIGLFYDPRDSFVYIYNPDLNVEV